MNQYASPRWLPEETLQALPSLDSTRPLPASDTLPPELDATFDKFYAALRTHFRPNAAVLARLSELQYELGLDRPRTAPIITCVCAHTGIDADRSASTGEVATNCSSSASRRPV